VLLDTVGCCWSLWDVVGWLLLGVVGWCWKLLDVVRCCWVPLVDVIVGAVGCCWVPLVDVVACCWVQLNVVGCCWAAVRGCWMWLLAYGCF